MKKFFSVLKKIGKILLLILSVGTVVFLFVKIRKAVLGSIRSNDQTHFREVPEDPHKIKLIKKDGSTEVVELPDGVKFKDVIAAGVTEGNKIVVEVLHGKVDKRNIGSGVSDNALDAIRSRVRPSNTD